MPDTGSEIEQDPAWLPAQFCPTLAKKGRHRKKAEGAMFELMICSLVTIVPDYLYRR